MLQASGVRAAAAGNTEVPLVAAIDDPAVDVFVVEASSFRIDHSERFAPNVGTWLNFSPDHLNLHRSLESYELAKAKLWRDQSPSDVAIGSVDDAVVMRHLAAAPARHITFGLGDGADYRVEDDRLVTDAGEVLADVAELPAALSPRPHEQPRRRRHRARGWRDDRRLSRRAGALRRAAPPHLAGRRARRRALVRRFEGDHAERHAHRDEVLRLDRPDRRRAEQGPRPRCTRRRRAARASGRRDRRRRRARSSPPSPVCVPWSSRSR